MAVHHVRSTIHTPDGTRTLIERHYEAQKDLALLAIQGMATGSNPPQWYYPGAYKGEKSSSYGTNNTLTLAVQRCLGIVDSECAEMISAVSSIAERIADAVPELAGMDVRRIRVQGRSGFKVNPHAILRGNLATAWTKIEQEAYLHTDGVVTLVLCTDYTANASDLTAQYTIGATLALAQKIEETGRRVEIWASILTHDAHNMRKESYGSGTSWLAPGGPQTFDELDHCIVKQADEELSAPCMAALCSLDLVRSLFFYIWRLQYNNIGFLCNTGCATNKAQVYSKLQPYLQREHINPAQVLMGADESDHLYSLNSAVAWVSTWLQHVSDAEDTLPC